MNLNVLLVLCLLLVLPGWALARLATLWDWRIPIGWVVLLSLGSFVLYRNDKRRAEAGAWRISETALHLTSLLGGWPGSFLAQRIFRHKTAKGSFQMVFWLIVLAYQIVALDFVLGWRLAGELRRSINL